MHLSYFSVLSSARDPAVTPPCTPAPHKLVNIYSTAPFLPRDDVQIPSNKYRLSLIDPGDKIVLQTQLDDLCDKLQWSSVGVRRYYQVS